MKTLKEIAATATLIAKASAMIEESGEDVTTREAFTKHGFDLEQDGRIVICDEFIAVISGRVFEIYPAELDGESIQIDMIDGSSYL